MNKNLKKLSVVALKYLQMRAKALKSMAALSDRFAKLRDPVSEKVTPQLLAAKELGEEIIEMLKLPEMRQEFVKPKSQTLHGVSVGFNLSKEKLRFDSEEAVIASIKALFIDASLYVVSHEKLDLNALKLLDTDTLKRVGISKIEGTNTPFVRLDDGLEEQTKALGLGTEES